MTSNRDQLSLKKLRNEEIKSLLGPCMISFAIPLLIPGLTITLVAFSDETGFSKYGALHIVGILILSAACVLLVVGCVIKCTCKSKVFPMMQVASHKVTTHEKPKQVVGVALTRDRLPPLNGPLPGGSSIIRDQIPKRERRVPPCRSSGTDDSGSDSGDITVSASEDNLYSSRSEKNKLHGLPANNFMSEPSNNNTDKTLSQRKETTILIENTDSGKSYGVTNTTSSLQVQNATLSIEDEGQSTKAALACPSYTNMLHHNGEHGIHEENSQLSPDEETRMRKPVGGWVSRQSDAKLMGASKISPETLSHSESSEVTDDRDADEDDDDDATLTEASRNCSTVPEIADLDRDDAVEVDRFNNVWRGESQNSVEISSVLSQEEYSEESLSVVSKDQLEIAEPSGSRGRASTDSAMESGGDHSRALSHRISDRVETNGRLMEDLEGGGERPRPPSRRVSDRVEATGRLGDSLEGVQPRALPRRVSDSSFR